jgi:UMF1 family MFS transporter
VGDSAGHGLSKAERMSKREWSWVLYDVGNSAFILLATAVAPIYYGTLTTHSVVVDWGFAETLVSLVVALLMPVLGSLADFEGNKMKFFIGTMGTGVVACAAASIPTEAQIFLMVYVIASIGYNASVVFYDAFLIDATTEERYDSVSSNGYAWGYVGSLIPFLICLALIFGGKNFGIPSDIATRASFVITAVWWLIFSFPLIRNVKQRHFKPHVQHEIAKTFAGLGATVRHIVKDKTLLFFVLAFFCYIDGVHTIIKMAASYGTDLGIDTVQIVVALVATQIVAFPAALVYGRLAKRFGVRIMLIISTIAYALITLYAAFFMRTDIDFWILALCVGLFQGGIQALSRSYFGRLIPKDHANEYFGFFDIFGKYATIIGTLLLSVFTVLTGNASLGILSITILFVLGAFFLIIMPERDAAHDGGAANDGNDGGARQ